MGAEERGARAVDPEGAWLYRAGGLSALAIGVGYLAIIPLYARAGAAPSGDEAWLRYLAGRTAEWWAILGLSVLTDVLFIPVALALYRVLEGINRGAMRVATALVGLFVAVDLAVTWSNYAALIVLSGRYATATTDAQRAVAVAAAGYASAVLTSRLEAVYSILILSCAILAIGLVMLRGAFGKGAAYVGVAAGALGIVAVASASGVAVIIESILTTVWALVVGYRLYRLGLGRR